MVRGSPPSALRVGRGAHWARAVPSYAELAAGEWAETREETLEQLKDFQQFMEKVREPASQPARRP
jgi:hypothetical protein